MRNPGWLWDPGATHLQGMMTTAAELRPVSREGLAGAEAARPPPPQPLVDAAPQAVGARSGTAALQVPGEKGGTGYVQRWERTTPPACPQGKGQDLPRLPAGHTSPSCCPSAHACWRNACPSPRGGRRGCPGVRTCRGRGSSPAERWGGRGQLQQGGQSPAQQEEMEPTVAPNSSKGLVLRRHQPEAKSRSRRAPSTSISPVSGCDVPCGHL